MEAEKRERRLGVPSNQLGVPRPLQQRKDQVIGKSDINAQIVDYFNVKLPHSLDDRLSREGDWAQKNREEIAAVLLNKGPALWYSKIEVIRGSGIFTPANVIDATAEAFFSSFGYDPATLNGKRILDIGAFSGAMSFYAEDCGAEVVSLDIQNPDTNGFSLIHDIRKSTVTHVMAAIYDIHPDLFGLFDIVVFSGVHYHLKHPLLALERLNSVTKIGGELLTVGTTGDYWLHMAGASKVGADLTRITISDVRNNEPDVVVNSIPIIGFYKNCYMGDSSNWFIPNTSALADMISASGYEVTSKSVFPMPRSIHDAVIGCCAIKAHKTGGVSQEYAPDVYAHTRRFDESSVQSSTITIPTWYELERERRRAAVSSNDA
ncbi:MAG: class I SAM-dependent methyltransferase [Acetobacteraceae bacterium]